MASFTDNFNRADSGTVGNDWLEKTDSEAQILSQNLRIGGAVNFGSSIVYRPASEDFKNGSVETDFTVTAGSETPQIHMRYNPSANTSYLCYITTTQLIIAKMTGVATVVTLASTSFTSDSTEEYTLKFELYGNIKRATISYKNTGAPITVVEESTDTTHTTAGSSGVSNNVSGFVDYGRFFHSGEVDKSISPTGVLHNGTSVIASDTGITAYVLDFLSGERVTTVGSLTTDANGNLSSIDNDSIDNKRYKVLLKRSNGDIGLIRRSDENYPRIYVNSSDLQTGRYTAVKYDGLGIPGSQVPSTGRHSGGFIYASLNLPIEDNDEFRADITTPPAVIEGGGAIVGYRFYDDTSGEFDFTGIGKVQWTFDVIKNNVSDTTGLSGALTFGVIQMTADDMTVNSLISEPLVQLNYDLTVDDMTVTGSMTQPTFDLFFDITPEDMAVNVFMTDANFSGVFSLTVDDSIVNGTINSPSLSESFNVTVNDLFSSPVMTEPSFAVTGVFGADNMVSGGAMTEPTLVQQGVLNVSNITVQSIMTNSGPVEVVSIAGRVRISARISGSIKLN